MFHFVFLEKKCCFLLAAGDIHLNFCRKGNGINLGFEGAKGKKAVECGGQECKLRIDCGWWCWMWNCFKFWWFVFGFNGIFDLFGGNVGCVDRKSVV